MVIKIRRDFSCTLKKIWVYDFATRNTQYLDEQYLQTLKTHEKDQKPGRILVLKNWSDCKAPNF